MGDGKRIREFSLVLRQVLLHRATNLFEWKGSSRWLASTPQVILKEKEGVKSLVGKFCQVGYEARMAPAADPLPGRRLPRPEPRAGPAARLPHRRRSPGLPDGRGRGPLEAGGVGDLIDLRWGTGFRLLSS